VTGEIYIARVIHGGLADRSGEKSLIVLYLCLWYAILNYHILPMSILHVSWSLHSCLCATCLKVFCMLVIGWWK